MILSSSIRDIHRQMDLDPLSLKFCGGTEKGFNEYYFKYSIDFVRLAILISMAYYMLFYLLDIVIFPNYKLEFILIRVFVCFIIGFSVFLLSYKDWFRKHWQMVIFSLVVISGSSLVAMLMFSTRPLHFGYYVGLVLILMYNYIFSKLKFGNASAAGWLLFLAYFAAVNLKYDVPLKQNYMHTFFFASANIFGMVGTYLIEYYTRREYFIINLLNREKNKFERLNDTLEDKVRVRTKELKQLNEELNEHKGNLEGIVHKRTLELQEKINELKGTNEELERFNKLFVDREFRIKELKDELKAFKKQSSGN